MDAKLQSALSSAVLRQRRIGNHWLCRLLPGGISSGANALRRTPNTWPGATPTRFIGPALGLDRQARIAAAAIELIISADQVVLSIGQ